ncbi:MAG: hypothetical protein IKF18_06055 [Erysipelotrichaceae bacterium]|nr:hypothetical protein [Erysipelotrichaceae bacterium]
MYNHYVYDGTKKFDITKAPTSDKKLCSDREEAAARMQANNVEIDSLQSKLYADKKEGLIILFQAMDAAGKDGTIRAVLQCLSPHGVHESAFKAPNSTDLAHDFLWRIESEVPMKGEIAIFNRSHYEDVLIGKVKELYMKQDYAERIDRSKIIEYRYEDIKNWETYLWHNNVRVVKIFLNVSKEEQAARFLSRIEEPEKNWKFSENDWNERSYWDAYQQAFEDCINKTSTKIAPWYVVPADHKWYMRYVVSEIILSTLREMNPKYPEVTEQRRAEFQQLREAILAELPEEKAQEASAKAKMRAARKISEEVEAKKKQEKNTRKKVRDLQRAVEKANKAFNKGKKKIAKAQEALESAKEEKKEMAVEQAVKQEKDFEKAVETKAAEVKKTAQPEVKKEAKAEVKAETKPAEKKAPEKKTAKTPAKTR